MRSGRWFVTALAPAGLMFLFVALRSDRGPSRDERVERAAPPPPPPARVPTPPARFVGAAPTSNSTTPPAAPDLLALRRALPDNVYWSSGAPTTDPQALATRTEQQAADNVLYGRVLSGTATEDEVRRYYQAVRRRSQDYLRLAEEALRRQGDRMSERDRGLFELAARLHRERLATLPREEERALERRRLQEQRRRAWQQQQQRQR
jgi:hypothetical protein